MRDRGDPLYALTRLELAVQRLVGAEGIRERLLLAGMALELVQPRDFPKELREQYLRVRDALISAPTEEGRRTLRATLEEITDARADILAKEILDLYLRMADTYHAGRYTVRF